MGKEKQQPQPPPPPPRHDRTYNASTSATEQKMFYCFYCKMKYPLDEEDAHNKNTHKDIYCA